MIKHILLPFLLLSVALHSQSISKTIIGSSGGEVSNSTMQLRWSVGEPVVGLMTSSNGVQLGNGYYSSLDVSALSVSDETIIAPKIILYPNPTEHHIYIQQETAVQLSVVIFDVLGKEVLKRNIAPNEYIDVAKLKAGVYTVQLIDTTTNYKYTYKIIKR